MHSKIRVPRQMNLFGVMADDERWMSVREACDLLGITKKTMYVWMKKGIMPALGTGSLRRVRFCDMPRFQPSRQPDRDDNRPDA